MKFKTSTEKFFNKEKVFSWIENIENVVISLEQMAQIHKEHFDNCETCPLNHKYCGVVTVTTITKKALEIQLEHLYKIVENNKWEDEDND